MVIGRASFIDTGIRMHGAPAARRHAPEVRLGTGVIFHAPAVHDAGGPPALHTCAFLLGVWVLWVCRSGPCTFGA